MRQGDSCGTAVCGAWPMPPRSLARCCAVNRPVWSSRRKLIVKRRGEHGAGHSTNSLPSHIVELDEERKAAMVSNLLVVLTSTGLFSPWSMPERSIRMTDRKSFLLRLNPTLHRVLERWASDEFRSLNSQKLDLGVEAPHIVRRPSLQGPV